MKSLDFVFKGSYKCLGHSVEKVFWIKKSVQTLKAKKTVKVTRKLQ